jgi:CheY-like chemotaxis protein
MVAWKKDVDVIPLHTVLIISDQPKTVAVWDSLFNQRNCIVISESAVSDALQTARLLGPSLMLIDMQLSKMERAQLLSKPRTDPDARFRRYRSGSCRSQPGRC